MRKQKLTTSAAGRRLHRSKAELRQDDLIRRAAAAHILAGHKGEPSVSASEVRELPGRKGVNTYILVKTQKGTLIACYQERPERQQLMRLPRPPDTLLLPGDLLDVI